MKNRSGIVAKFCIQFSRTARKARATLKPRLHLLEERAVPTVISALSGSQLNIQIVPDNQQLTAYVRLQGGNVEVADNAGFAGAATFASAQVGGVNVQGGGAAESVWLTSGVIPANLTTTGVDAVSFAPGSSFVGSISISNAGSDTTLANLVSNSGSISTSVTGGKLLLSGLFSALSGVNLNAPVLLQTNVVVNGGMGNVTFGGTVDATSAGGQSLDVTSPGNTLFSGNVGGTTALSSIKTRSVAPLSAPTIASTTANIPLYYLPQAGNYYLPQDASDKATIKYGIEVSIGENNPPRMYLFDSGGEGFFPTYDSEAFAGVPLGTQPVRVQYTSGIFYDGFVTSAKVTIGAGAESVSTAVPVQFGAWPQGGNVNNPNSWSTGPQTPKVGQLYGDFGGAFGFADPSSTFQGLSSILWQLPGNYSSGYVVRLGPVGGPATLTIGLTNEMRQQFPYAIPLTQAANLFYPVSNRQAYQDFAFSPTYTISNGAQSYNLGQLPTICDTGAPSTNIRYPYPPPGFPNPFPFLDSNKQFQPGTVLSGAFPTAAGFPALTWTQTVGMQQSVNKFGYSDESGAATNTNNVNTGLNLFSQYDVMFDIESGMIRLRPNAGIGTVTIGSVKTTGDQEFGQNVNLAGTATSSAGRFTIGGKTYLTGNSTISTAAHPILFSNTIDGANSLAINSASTVTFGSSVGQYQPIKSLTVSAAHTFLPTVSVATISSSGRQEFSGLTHLNGSVVSIDEEVKFNGPVLLAGPSEVTSSKSSVGFHSKVNGAFTLFVSAKTSAKFYDTVGDSQPLAGLTLDAPEATSSKSMVLNGTAAGAQTDGMIITKKTKVTMNAPGNSISGFQGSGISFAGESRDSQLSNFTISGNVGNGIEFNSPDGGRVDLSGTRIIDNIIIGNGGFGVEFAAAVKGIRLEQNTIGQAGVTNPWGFVSGGPNTHGIALAGGDYLGSVIGFNTITYNRRDGIFAPAGVTGLSILSNVIEDNGAHGIEFFTGNFAGTTLTGNRISYNLGDGIAIGTGIVPTAGGGDPRSGYTGIANSSGRYLLQYHTSPLVNGLVRNDPNIAIQSSIFSNGSSGTTIAIPLDTGSRGLYVDISQIAPGTDLGTNKGYIYLNSSNRIFYGNWVNQTITFTDSSYIDSNGNAQFSKKATAKLPILIVTAVGATTTPQPGSTTASTTFSTTASSGSITITNGVSTQSAPITPSSGGGGVVTIPGGWWANYADNTSGGQSLLGKVANFGIGFDRTGQGTYPTNGSNNQGYNAFLNLSEMRQGTMRAGYVITPEHIILGLDRSISGYSYTDLTATGLSQSANSPPDWQPATGTLVYGGQTYSTGPIVIDMGIPSGILTLPGQTATSEFNQQLTVNLLNSGGGISYDINYNSTSNLLNPSSVSFFNPLSGNYSNNAPQISNQFFNTGRYLFSAFNYLYDATGGYLGLSPINSSVISSANGHVPTNATHYANPVAPSGVTNLLVGSQFGDGGNVISSNGGNGVNVNGSGSISTILSNTIIGNGTQGISLTDGGNASQPAPTLATTSAFSLNGQVTVTGNLQQQAGYYGLYLIQFFVGSMSSNGQQYQAESYLGSITQTAGNFTTTVQVDPAYFGQYIIATATPLAGPQGTSAFSTGSRITNSYYATATGPGGGSHVKVFNSATGGMIREFNAFDSNFKGGVSIAVGDVTGDGIPDIVAGALAGGGPHVKVFDGRDFTEFSSFFPFPMNFAGGVNVAVGNLDSDPAMEIITAAGPGGGPHVRSFDIIGSSLKGAGSAAQINGPLGSFYPYDKSFTGGVNVAAGRVAGQEFDEVVTGPGQGGGPHVRAFSTTGEIVLNFLAYDPKFTGGVFVAAGALESFGVDTIVTGTGSGGGPHVRLFRKNGDSAALQGEFMAYDPSFIGGVRVAVGDYKNSGLNSIFTAPGQSGGPHVKVFDPTNLSMVGQFMAYDPAFLGGIYVGGTRSIFAVGDAPTGDNQAKARKPQERAILVSQMNL